MALTSTISNTITDPHGGVVANVPVTVTLQPTAGFRVDDATEVARVVSTTTNGSGVWSLTLERNSNITPSSTYYTVDEQIPVASGGTRTWNIQVGASDQTVSAALVTPLPAAQASGFLTQASADARYQALGSLGSATPSNANVGDAGTAGVSTSASRSDHGHVVPTAAPVATGDANAAGSATTHSRSDHVHKGVVAAAAWATWSPTITNVTLGNGTVTARFLQVGKMVQYRLTFLLGSTSAMGTNPLFTLPVTASSTYTAAANNVSDVVGAGMVQDVDSANYGALVWLNTLSQGRLISMSGASGATSSQVTATVPFTWATGDGFSVSGTYEAA